MYTHGLSPHGSPTAARLPPPQYAASLPSRPLPPPPIYTSYSSQAPPPLQAPPASTSPARDAPPVVKGLENRAGSNHCFLNVIIQSLWNLRSFREAFLAAREHVHRRTGGNAPRTEKDGEGQDSPDGSPGRSDGPPAAAAAAAAATAAGGGGDGVGVGGGGVGGETTRAGLTTMDGLVEPDEYCVYCALKSLFANYAFGQHRVLPPDAVRLALSHSFDKRFRLCQMEDADETLEAILTLFHKMEVLDQEGASVAGVSYTECLQDMQLADAVCNPACIAHNVFGFELLDVSRCPHCGETSEPDVLQTFTYRVKVSELLGLAHTNTGTQDPSQPRKTLEQCLAFLWQRDDQPDNDQSGPSGGSGPGLHPYLSTFLGLGSRFGDTRAPAAPPPAKRCDTCRRELPPIGRKTRFCMKRPKVFVCSLYWPAAKTTSQNIWDVLSLIHPFLDINKVFVFSNPPTPQGTRPATVQRYAPPTMMTCQHPPHQQHHYHPYMPPRGGMMAPPRPPPHFPFPPPVAPGTVPNSDGQLRGARRHVFRGAVCYYGRHYVAYFFSWAMQKWVLFDDSRVRIEDDWTKVANMIATGAMMPCLLFFEQLHVRHCHSGPAAAALTRDEVLQMEYTSEQLNQFAAQFERLKDQRSMWSKSQLQDKCVFM